jgi:hypothetical protein
MAYLIVLRTARPVTYPCLTSSCELSSDVLLQVVSHVFVHVSLGRESNIAMSFLLSVEHQMRDREKPVPSDS